MAGNRTFNVTVRINQDGTSQFVQDTKKVTKAQKDQQSGLSKLKGSYLAATAAVAGLVAAVTKGAQAFVNAARDALEYDRQIRRLQAGVDGSVASLEAQAKALSVLTGETDTAIVSAQALIAQFGASAAETEKLTLAAAEVSKALGITFEQAAAQVAKTLGGYAGELGELVPALKELSKEQLQSAGAAEVLTAAFGGTVAATRNSATGFANLRNAVDEFVREIAGSAIEVEGLTQALDSLAQSVRGSSQPVVDFTNGLGVLAERAGLTLDRVLLLVRGLGLLLQAFPPIGAILGISNALGTLAGEIADLGAESREAAEAQKALEESWTEGIRAANQLNDAVADTTFTHRELVGAYDELIRQSPQWQRAIEEAEKVVRDKEEALEDATTATDDQTQANERLRLSEQALRGQIEEANAALGRRVDIFNAQGQRTGSRLTSGPSDPLFPGISGATYSYTIRRSQPTEDGGVTFT